MMALCNHRTAIGAGCTNIDRTLDPRDDKIPFYPALIADCRISDELFQPAVEQSSCLEKYWLAI
jgi:hypothetical protein